MWVDVVASEANHWAHPTSTVSYQHYSGWTTIVVRNERTIADDYKVYALSNEHSSNITNNCKTLVGDLKLMEECVESLTKLVELEIFSRIQ